MKIIPVMTEKSLKLVKSGGFNFWVSTSLKKVEIKKLISETFGVYVTKIKTLNYKARTKKNNRGKIQKIKAGKKTIVFLKEGEKIDLFEEEKKLSKAKSSSAGKKITEKKAK